jgi:hypothetical protein
MSQRCHWHRCDMHSSVITPLCRGINFEKSQRSHWHRCDVHSGVIDTAVQIWLRCDFWLLFARLWLPLKGISIEKTYIGQLSYTIPITFTHKKWGLTWDRFLSQRCHWHRCDKNRRIQSRFARRILIHIEKGFNPCIRGLGGVVWWKKQEVENLVSGSL